MGSKPSTLSLYRLMRRFWFVHIMREVTPSMLPHELENRIALAYGRSKQVWMENPVVLWFVN